MTARRTWMARVVVCVLAVQGLCASMALAQDGVKLSGHWVEPVTVQGMDDGQVRYVIASGRALSRPLSTVEGLKLGRYPLLAEAEGALADGDDPAALAAYGRVIKRADEDWVRWYVGMRLVAVHGRLDDADTASGIYIDMVVSGAGLWFVAEPPVDVVARADVAVRLRVLKLADTAIGTVGPDRGALLRRLVEAAGKPTLPGDMKTDDTTTNTDPQGEPITADGAIALSASVPPGSIADLYRRGRYEQAMSVADEALTQPGKTASELYLKGMAQLALAERDDDQAGYKSAGLSFMRVVVYFPRSAVAGPAMLEAGYIHERIGRADIAEVLYGRARPLIDRQEDPATYQRLMRRIGSVNDATTGD